MKQLLSILTGMILLSVFIQACNDSKKKTVKERKVNSFQVIGYFTGFEDSTKLLLKSLYSGKVLDSALVLNDSVFFEGSLSITPEELRISSTDEDFKQTGFFHYTDLLIGHEQVTLIGDKSDFPNLLQSAGSASQKAAEQYWKARKKYQQRLTAIQEENEPNSISIKDSLKNWEENYLKENFNSYYALLQYSYRRDFTADTLSALYQNLPTELKSSVYGQALKTSIDYPKPTINEFAYNIQGVNRNDEPVELFDIEDKYILLQFAGDGCYGSGKSTGEMLALEDKMSDSIVFVSHFFDSKSLCMNPRNENIKKATWHTSWQDGRKFADAVIKYGVIGTPTFFLISPDKKVIHSWFGHREGYVEENIRKALGSELAVEP